MKEFRAILFSIFVIIDAGLSLYGQSYYKVKQHPVSTRLNNEECPVMTGNQLIFLSNRSNSSIKKYFDPEERNYFDMYLTELDTATQSWSASRSFIPELRTNYSDGPVSFDSTGNLLAFSRNLAIIASRGADRNNPYNGIYFADKDGETWINLREFTHNVIDAHTSHPALDQTGNIMYFSSNRSGGFGGYDLYVSRFENGSWTNPQNLGPRINTTGNEVYPFLHPSGRLYFSSEGHDNNIGGYDIFYSEFYNGNWINPVKLPGPFNSGLKDFTYFADEKFEKGFFTTNRRGSVDIFSFESTLPAFEVCQEQKIDNFCFILFEENTVELDTNLYAYEWNLGDGEKVRDIEARHCYAGPGNYLVRLDVIDKLTNEVLFNQATYDLKIERIEQAFITCPDTILINQDIQFNGLQSYFKTIQPGEYYWDFGNGEKGTGASFRYNYKVPGMYTIKLGVVEDNEDVEIPKKFCSFRTIMVRQQ